MIDETAELDEPPSDALKYLADLVMRRKPLLVLTGAGCSTASGIPDYRGPDGHWKHSQPTRYQAFVASRRARQRYWARSLIGWPRIERAQPNAAHEALAALEHAGIAHQLVTQNVDGLHQRAGQRRVVDLHGQLAWVDCLDCRLRLPRTEMQGLLEAANSLFATNQSAMAPDGDAVIDEALVRTLRVPDCPTCGGMLKPAVVFFGENVPRSRVEYVRRKLLQSRALLVVGSSLTVFSGFRFCREAAEHEMPIAIINRGQTRADDLAAHKLDVDVGHALLILARMLGIEVKPAPRQRSIL